MFKKIFEYAGPVSYTHLYDMFNMQKYGLFDETQEPLFRKCIMFYAAIASETVPEYFDLNGIRSV